MPLADYLRSTPFRIATTYAGLFAASVMILFGVVYWLVSEEMTSELQSVIDKDIASLMAVYRERGSEGLKADIEDRIADTPKGDSLYLYRDKDGNAVSSNTPSGAPVLGWQDVGTILGSGRHDTDGAAEHFLARGVQTADSFLLVGRSLHGLKEVQEVLLRALTWALGLTAVLALGGGIGLGHGALRRVDSINRAFREITEGHLSRRVSTSGTRDELDRLAVNINLMLDRIEQLMANLQQVSNDIAHDLRTPLGRLRQGLESARRKESSVQDYRTAIDRAIEQADTILDTFSALLRIAQIESRSRRGRFETVDLSELANRIVEAYETVIEDADQSLTAEIAPGVRAGGDRDLIIQMLANLVENATRHCPAGSHISIALTNDTAPTVTVADTGPGIPEDARDAVLRRFYRLEGSRTTPGSGLGLALVKAIADLHNATLLLSDNRPGLRVTIRFPAGMYS